MTSRLTLVGHSTALFSTWFFVEELRLLLDAGDGVMATPVTGRERRALLSGASPARRRVSGEGET